MSNYDNTTRRQFPTAFGGQRRGGGGGYNNRGGAGRGRYQEVRYPAPEKKEEKKTVNIASELDFPSIGSDGGWAASKPSTCPGTSSFATLAQKWKKDEEDEEARIKFEKEEYERKKLEESRYLTTSRILGRNRARSTTVYDDEGDCDDYDHYEALDRYDEEMKRKATETEEEWSTVERR